MDKRAKRKIVITLVATAMFMAAMYLLASIVTSSVQLHNESSPASPGAVVAAVSHN